MKTFFKTTCIILLTIITFSCDNDTDPSPNDDQCNYQGLTFLDTNSNTQTLISEADLTTTFFPNNGGTGVGGIEINKTTDPGSNWFTTDAVTLNATGTGTIRVNGTTYNVNVTCQRAGVAVGDEFRFDITGGGAEAEFCVIIDIVTP